jgi:hypothetical protein
MFRMMLLLIGLVTINAAAAQNLSGKWVGYFTTNTGITYPYEINIQDDGNSNLTATTLTRFSISASAKATAKGTFTKQSKLATILETRFEQLSLTPNSQACLMNNYLTYSNVKGSAILQGTYISNNYLGAADCGTGTVVLIKESESIIAKKVTKEIKKIVAKKDNAKLIAAQTKLKQDTITSNATIVVAEAAVTTIKFDTIVNATKASSPIVTKKKEFINIPWVLISRDNKLIKTLITNNQKISIDLFDNGSFDSDSVSVYDNNVLLFDRIKLSYKEFHFDLSFNEAQTQHELILVAHKSLNATRNSSILIYKDNNKREEFFINTNHKSNAKIIVKYDPIAKSSD